MILYDFTLMNVAYFTYLILKLTTIRGHNPKLF